MTVLYGVQFQGQFDVLLLTHDDLTPFVITFDAKPSKMLLDDIARLPRGSSILVDDIAPAELASLPRTFDGVEINFSTNREYFTKINSLCVENGVHRIFLRTAKAYTRFASSYARKVRLENHLAKLEDPLPYKIDLIREELYAIVVEQDYRSIIQSEQRVMDILHEQSPAIAILADAQANYLSPNSEFDAYHREILPPRELLLCKFNEAIDSGCGPIEAEKYLRKNMISNKLIENAKEIDDVLQHELTRRRFLALKYKRVSNGFPDFFGSWGSFPHLGVMELYITHIDGENIDAVVEDVYATTPAHGKISANHIEFTRMMPDSTGKLREMFYFAERNGTEFQGEFEHPEISGKFSLWPARRNEC